MIIFRDCKYIGHPIRFYGWWQEELFFVWHWGWVEVFEDPFTLDQKNELPFYRRVILKGRWNVLVSKPLAVRACTRNGGCPSGRTGTRRLNLRLEDIEGDPPPLKEVEINAAWRAPCRNPWQRLLRSAFHHLVSKCSWGFLKKKSMESVKHYLDK